jgi:hypothetical protein
MASKQEAHHVAFAGPVLRAAVSTTDTAENTVIAAAGAGKKIRILSMYLVSAGTVVVTLKSASTALSGAIPMVANQDLTLNHNPFGWHETAANEAFVISKGADVDVVGGVVYQVTE